jgi:hypothetical protein
VKYQEFFDSLEIAEPKITKFKKKALCFKRLVSKKKKRFQDDIFDLDLVYFNDSRYITKRVIAMGFPSSGFESLFRNSVKDVALFFNIYHENNVKIYNLCLESNRIYDKKKFKENPVALFPSLDHHPCSVK